MHCKENEMKKRDILFTVRSAEMLGGKYALLKMTPDGTLPDMRPGQFVEVYPHALPMGGDVSGEACGACIAGVPLLRRPISINYVDKSSGTLWLLVAMIGPGTRRIGHATAGERLRCLCPLGCGFDMPAAGERVLVVGGGVGVAPLLFLCAEMCARGVTPTILLGARSAADVLEADLFGRCGTVHVTTEDGTAGERGYVTDHSVLRGARYDKVYACGPKAMMLSVARAARGMGAECFVSLENMMGCGVGACLCCVEKTVDGNVCVCTDGPVFNVNRLLWRL